MHILRCKWECDANIQLNMSLCKYISVDTSLATVTELAPTEGYAYLKVYLSEWYMCTFFTIQNVHKSMSSFALSPILITYLKS